jgi:hypothetical protein
MRVKNINWIKKILLLSIFGLNSYASIQTIEGLFRNGNNADVSGDLVVLTFQVREKINREFLNKKIVENEQSFTEIENVKEGLLKLYVKLIYKYEIKKPTELILVTYDDVQMKTNSVINVEYINNLEQYFKNSTNKSKELLYSILNSLLLNDSRLVSQFLKRNNTNYLTNAEILNKEKKDLLEDYKKYLLAVREDESMRNGLRNPMKPDKIEDREATSKILKSAMYQIESAPKLVKEQGDFIWKVELENFSGKFENETRRLMNVKANLEKHEVYLTVFDYVLFDGIHEFPKYIYLQKNGPKETELRTLSLKHLTLKKAKKMTERFEKYKSVVKKSELILERFKENLLYLDDKIL